MFGKYSFFWSKIILRMPGVNTAKKTVLPIEGVENDV